MRCRCNDGALTDGHRYTSGVERQLKERLIGAAVLLAAAVVMVPEMFSGPASRPVVPETEVAPSGQLKTYRIELQSAQSVEATTAPVEQPAPEPDMPVAPGEPAELAASSSSAAASASDGAAMSSARSTEVLASVVSRPAAQPVEKPIEKPMAKPAEPVRPPSTETSPKTTVVKLPASSAMAQSDKSGAAWAVQVGSFGTQEKAQEIAGKLKAQGYPAFVGPVKVGSKTLYRVRVSAGSERAKADATLQKLKAGYPGASVVPAAR